MTHICVGKLTTIVSDNGLSPGPCQAIIGTNAGILLFGPLGTIFSEISIGIQTFSVKKMHLRMSSAKWRPFCLRLNVLNQRVIMTTLKSLVKTQIVIKTTYSAISDHKVSIMLTHWGQDKMDAILQTIFSCAFSSMKIAVFWLNFHWNMFARVQLTIIQHWLR